MNTPTVEEFAHALFRQSSAFTLQRHCRTVEPMTITEMDVNQNPEVELGERLSTIMVLGRVGRFVLKTHFDISSAAAWMAHASDQSEASISDDLSIDFMREYSNLHASLVRSAFASQQIILGMSLPLILQGASVNSMRKEMTAPAYLGGWSLDDGQRMLHITAELHISDPTPIHHARLGLEKYMEVEAARKDIGTVEFLDGAGKKNG